MLKDQCVGCGLCQTRCSAINVKEKGLLSESAIIIETGEGLEDRLMKGSYVQLRADERSLGTGAEKNPSETDYFVPDASPSTDPSGVPSEIDPDDPFGVSIN